MVEARIDLHVHSSHSEDRERYELPGGTSFVLPFHPTLGPLEVYDLALAAGMTHVTITDHDTLDGCLEILERHPDPSRLLTGEEVSCYHRGTLLHIGVYGLTGEDHAAIHAGIERADAERVCLRHNVPAFLDFCAARGLPVDLKHPLWLRAEAALTASVVREILPWFGLVETINGTRHRWLGEMSAAIVERLGRPGVGCTAGSDSHTDNVGSAWTLTHGETVAEVLDSLRRGDAQPRGAHGTHRLLDGDVRKCVTSNATGRAGHFAALTDDYVHTMPLLAQDLLNLLASVGVAGIVTSQLAMQRRLAKALAPHFAAELSPPVLAPEPTARAADPPLGDVSDARTAGGLVHRHL